MAGCLDKLNCSGRYADTQMHKFYCGGFNVGIMVISVSDVIGVEAGRKLIVSLCAVRFLFYSECGRSKKGGNLVGTSIWKHT